MVLFGRTVAIGMNDQGVSNRGMVTSGCDWPCFAISDAITQQRDKGHGGYGNLEL